ncbi:hypothetical protein [Paraburkholderia antibiotica]|uniref:MafI family immunity protein n=1 Tax=Paraburkholderia antibiotica TaxID=2728839 RepID=A0A7X9X3K8_9BURK|nr:hypothetical protein [Paraburkholderia antibiotica]NML30417.1 hypothetical protein [Paraburkholderia antibiotica]
MTKQQEHYDEIERLMRESLARVESDISKQDYKDVAEYIDFGEYGVAYELLICILDRQQTGHPESLKIAGKLMGMRS